MNGMGSIVNIIVTAWLVVGVARLADWLFGLSEEESRGRR